MLLFKPRESGIAPIDAVIIGDRLYINVKMSIEA